MPTLVALVRGINNIGKTARVSMAELRSVFTGLGYTNVVTLLNSGNVVFRAPRGAPAKHSANIAAAIVTQLKVDAAVIVKSVGELGAILSENPIEAEADQHSRFLVAFAQESKTLSTL